MTKKRARANRRHFAALWQNVSLHSNLNPAIQALINSYLQPGWRSLELGPGNRPALPLAGSYFIDLNPQVVNQLNRRGALARQSDCRRLEYPNEFFHCVCALHFLEHLANDQAIVNEIRRVLIKNGLFIFAVPTSRRLWTSFDESVGHQRRYEKEGLEQLLGNAFMIEKFALDHATPFGLDKVYLWFKSAVLRLNLPIAKLEGLDFVICQAHSRVFPTRWQKQAQLPDLRKIKTIIVAARKK